MPDRIDSKFRFVLLAAARAEQMVRGAQPKPGRDRGKVTSTAMDEIMADEVEWDYGPPPEPELEETEGSEAEGDLTG